MKPVLQALIIADHLYRDGTTGKWVIAGTFNRVFGSKKESAAKEESPPPAGDQARKVDATKLIRAGSPFVFISLTDIEDQIGLQLRYVALDDDYKVLMEAELAVTSKDRLETVEIGLPLPPLPIPREGVYALELLWNNELLGSLRITATITTGD